MNPWLIAAVLLASCGSDTTESEARGSDAGTDAGIDGTADAGAPADGSVDSACESASDPENCGACGRSCQGTACVNGRCVPVALWTPPTKVGGGAITTGEGRVFWSDATGRLFGIQATGGPPQVLADEGGRVTGMTFSEGVLYWTNRYNGTVRALQIPNGAPQTLLTTTGGPFDVALWPGESYLYVAKIDGNQLVKVPVTGGAEQLVASLAPRIHAVASDATSVVWVLDSAGEVQRLDKANGAISVLASGQAQPADVAIAQGSAFWVNFASVDAAVVRGALSGGAPTTLAEGQHVASIEVDDTFAYFPTPNVVWRVPLGGGPPLALADMPGDTQAGVAIAIDSSSVYWTEGAYGTLYKVAK